MKGIQTLIDKASDDITYIGTAGSGVDTSQKQWTIQKLSYSSGLLTAIQYAEGTQDAVNEWDERANYDYN